MNGGESTLGYGDLVTFYSPLACPSSTYPYICLMQSDEIIELTSKGIIPVEHDMASREDVDPMMLIKAAPHLSGQVAGAVTEILPAKQIVDQMVETAVHMIKRNASCLSRL